MMRSGYRKIVIACDSYKGCLTSREVNDTIAGALSAPEIITLEMSDGGEGMLDAFLSAMKGERVRIHAHDALMRWTEAEYGIVDNTAIIEIAQTAGLALIEPEQRNPMKATSWGVGEMIVNAYRRGVTHFIVGLGGSATSDCGNAQGYGRRLEDDTQGMQLCAGFRRYQSSLRRERCSSCLCSSKGSRL